MREPGAKDTVRPQLAAMLVRVDIVRVVASGAVVLEVPEGPALVEARGGHVNVPLTVACRLPQNRVQIALVEAACPRSVADGRLVRDRDPGRVHFEHIHVFHEVPERVIDQRADELDAGGQLRVVDGINLELVHLAGVARVFRPEAGLETARALAANDDPVPRVEALELVRSPHDLRDRQIADADAVGEPARIRHLVESVHVDGADRLAVAGRRERVQQEVVGLRELQLIDGTRIHCRVVIAQDRIVGEEFERKPQSARPSSRRCPWRSRPRIRWRPQPAACQNASSNLRSMRVPSPPKATSNRKPTVVRLPARRPNP